MTEYMSSSVGAVPIICTGAAPTRAGAAPISAGAAPISAGAAPIICCVLAVGVHKTYVMTYLGRASMLNEC